MATISRKELLAELLPALNKMFGDEYGIYHRKVIGGNEAVHQLVPIQLYNGTSSVDADDERISSQSDNGT